MCFYSEFFTNLADVNINGAVANNNVFTPDGGENFLPGKYLSRFGDQQGKQFKLFPGQ